MVERPFGAPRTAPLPDDVRREKNLLRQASLSRRDALSDAHRAAASQQVCEAVLAWLAPRPGAIVSAFWPIRSEIDIRPLLGHALARGVVVVLPRIDEGELTFRRWDGNEHSLVDGGFGTRVPPRDAAILDPEFVLVPLAAFDSAGGRIGYGKGYYDGALARLATKRRFSSIGVAFEVQRVDRVPLEEHDWRLDWLATEEGVRKADPAPL